MALHPVIQKMLLAMRAAGRPALSAGSPALPDFVTTTCC
jgi:hypothetical protein